MTLSKAPPTWCLGPPSRVVKLVDWLKSSASTNLEALLMASLHLNPAPQRRLLDSGLRPTPFGWTPVFPKLSELPRRLSSSVKPSSPPSRVVSILSAKNSRSSREDGSSETPSRTTRELRYFLISSARARQLRRRHLLSRSTSSTTTS